MPLNLPPQSFKDLTPLVISYNNVSKDDKIQKLFYLQKINYLLNKTELNDDLYDWINDQNEGGWLKELAEFSINPDASFFLKGMQFAKAIAEQIKKAPKIESTELDIYQLMQERDKLLKESDFEKCGERFIQINFLLNQLALNDTKVKSVIEKQEEILRLVAPKIKAIKGQSIDNLAVVPSYKTKELGNHVNNFNFKFTMSEWENPFVFRVEDRHELGWEQELHSYAVSRYFIEDYSVFMMRFKTEEGSIEYKPVILSQFANQNNLEEIANKLRGGDPRNIAPQIGYYFIQLTDFCSRLEDTHTFHPDIKLSNFLVNNYRVLISDRKTLTTNENPLATEILTSPLFAPDEFLKCLTFDKNGDPVGYNRNAMWKRMNMPQFMAFELGMALKQFLILTQLDHLPENFRNPDRDAASYFKSPSKQIVNLSLLVQELTRRDSGKRMTIKQFQNLLNYRNLPPDHFYNKVEEALPSSQLGIEKDVNAFNELLNSPLKGEKLLKRANPIFTKLSKSDPKETRLTRLAEKLAIRCYNEVSKPYYSNLSALIESEIQKEIKKINKLLKGSLSKDELLKQANPIFIKLFERQPEVPQLTELAKQLAMKCFKESSKSYFIHQLPALIDEKLLNKDWKQAPWYRKAIHWLTFGYFRVDRVTEVSSIKIPLTEKGKKLPSHLPQLLFLPIEALKNIKASKDNKTVDCVLANIEKERERREKETPSIKIPVDLKGEEFQLHFPQLEFVPSKDFESIGEKEGEHLEEYIFANLKEILAHGSSSDSSESDSELELDVENDGTVLITQKPEVTEKKPEDKDKNEVIKKEEAQKSGPAVDTKPPVKDSTPEANAQKEGKKDSDAKKTIPSKRSVHFFDAKKSESSKEEETPIVETPPQKKKQICRIDSVRTTLFRGDGSHGHGHKEQKPRLSDIVWEAPRVQ